ncbi:MAG: hypothetical protein Q9181_006854 [Wetmoreana brouardii]
MGVAFSQLFPPQANLTEHSLPSQNGKVFIVTGGYSGVGYQLASLLFQAGGKVYIAGRSEAKAHESIEKIVSLSSNTPFAGRLDYLALELDDLSTIKPSVEAFKRKESKVDILFNNAGVSLPPPGSASKQGYELQLATNCLGPFLFTQLLLPLLEVAAKTSPPGSVRVVWTTSQTAEMTAPKGGMSLSDLTAPPPNQTKNYVNSKTGNWFMAGKLADQVRSHGILSVVQNPGNLKTNLLRHAPKLMVIAAYPLLHNARQGAYTELWAGLSPELNLETNGAYVIPWGRPHPSPRRDIILALKSKQQGGTGLADEFWEWCGQQTAAYL